MRIIFLAIFSLLLSACKTFYTADSGNLGGNHWGVTNIGGSTEFYGSMGFGTSLSGGSIINIKK